MKLPSQSAAVRREFIMIRYRAAISPTMKWGIVPSSTGSTGSSGGPAPPDNPARCARTCMDCNNLGYPRCGVSTTCRQRHPSGDFPMGCYS